MENLKPTSNHNQENLMRQISEIYHDYEESSSDNEIFENIARIAGKIPVLER